jgi:hypothetical protein
VKNEKKIKIRNDKKKRGKLKI